MDDLYGLPLEEFTSARNELARELKKAGKAEEADAVRALKKPSATAWAVNQLARRRPRKIDRLIKAGDALRKAQRDVLAGKEGADVRAASRRQHELADELVGAARELLEEAGTRATAAAAQRISSTLRAASVEPGAVDDLRNGRLTQDVSSIGFGPLVHVAPKRIRRRQARPKQQAQKKKQRAATLRAKLADARKKVRAEQKALKGTEREGARLTRRLQAAERQAGKLEADLRRLR